jgi:hypothetical protein
MKASNSGSMLMNAGPSGERYHNQGEASAWGNDQKGICWVLVSCWVDVVLFGSVVPITCAMHGWTTLRLDRRKPLERSSDKSHVHGS